ncbi:ribosomal-protein-alanine N-acetyltransferase [Rathayibacter toxicus]|uniref:N-acetyltransferase domain-containing protein n=1 Tax=Rathayibacter toxicus TaxID=145458 RepID=A0A0C5BJ34_9MICO|nr:ribosomal protein S18-alanine N-acetyltransferase [Rathayibacter toxicus]AJM78320.1 hypothetical protein TI83_02945 [Rathayibacter toxicus]ALS58250.1 hypothetical protein APU90_03525 [Rathayibacter toxicus]KKM46441.1 hypothetical protein VT73_03970 [Rathayibacter toxicus]PPG23418.1 ribosomal-protein-alanine N-acetyltransferase [Rathayibacter toxicus]PPG48003.1 ribosomal-protein-alanine N-acetyltransferase [Rathayibacter toxicus]
MQLREATVTDLDAIMSIEEAEFPRDAWSHATMLREISGDATCYLLAEGAGDLLGYAGLLCPRGAQDGDIQTIAVRASARRTGIGRRLLRALLEIARARGAREVFLEVRADNSAAHSLYYAEGFTKIGVRRAYYQPDGVDAIVMRVPLLVRSEPEAS